MNIFAALASLEQRIRAVLRHRAQLRQLDADDRTLVAYVLRAIACVLDRLDATTAAYEDGRYMVGQRVPLQPQLRDAADRLEVAS